MGRGPGRRQRLLSPPFFLFLLSPANGKFQVGILQVSKDTLGKLLQEWRAGREPAAHSLLSGGSQEWERSVWEEKETISEPCRSLQGPIVKRQSLSSSSRLGLMMPGTRRHVYFLSGPRSLEARAMSALVAATPMAA